MTDCWKLKAWSQNRSLSLRILISPNLQSARMVTYKLLPESCGPWATLQPPDKSLWATAQYLNLRPEREREQPFLNLFKPWTKKVGKDYCHPCTDKNYLSNVRHIVFALWVAMVEQVYLIHVRISKIIFFYNCQPALNLNWDRSDREGGCLSHIWSFIGASIPVSQNSIQVHPWMDLDSQVLIDFQDLPTSWTLVTIII